MRILIGLAGLAVAVWVGFWFIGAATSERVMARWLEARASEGWLVNYAELETRGFPGAFETRLEALELADPETGWAWIAPEFTLEQPAYRPQRIRAVWPMTQSLASPFERLEIASEEIVAMIELGRGAALPLERSDMDMRAVTVASSEGWQSALATARLSVAREDGAEARYGVQFDATDLTPPGPLAALLDPAGLLPEAMAVMRYEAQMGFDRPWDITAIEVSRPQITDLALTEMRAEWGELLFRASGDLRVDADGYPEGEIAVRAENWREMIEMAVNAGVLPAEARGTVEATLGFIAGLSGRDSDIDAALGFRNRLMFLGPLPIGQAPRLILR